MRLEKVTFHEVGPFPHFEIDLTALPPGAKVVALVGENGAGKTFSLEAAVLGACYRKMATQGTLIGRARARDSYMESRLVNGHAYTITHYLDAVSRKGESSVFVDGEEAYRGTSVSKFDKWAEKHLPAEDVVRATIFAVQGSGGFLDLGSAERISIILRACGVERIERIAERARKNAARARDALDGLATRIADARGGTLDVDTAAAELERRQAEERDATAALEAARKALAAAEAEDKQIEKRREVVALVRKNRERITNELATARAAVPDIETRITNNRSVLAEADRVRAAVADVERLKAEIATERAAAQKQETEAHAKAEAARAADGELRDLDVRIERSESVLATRATIEEAVAALLGLEIAVNEAAGAVGVAEDVLTDLQGERVAGAEDRIRDLRTGLQAVETKATTIAIARGVARESLKADDQAVASATALPEQLKQAEAAVRSARARKEESERKLAAARTTAARRGAIDAAEHDLAAAKARRAEVEKVREAAAAAEHVATDAAREHRSKATTAETALATVQPVAAKAGPLAGAEGRLTELEPALVAAREKVATLEAELASAPAPDDVPAGPALSPLERAVRDAEGRDRAATAAKGKALQLLEDARRVAFKVETLEAERRVAEAELADWTRLALDFGRDGIQSAEVDSAGPELTALANDLLRCFGSRYTVSIETQRLGADGTSLIEECRVNVIDSEQGHEGEAREFSGGQKVILSEAVSLALTMLSCRRSGVERPTLIRDESSAALSPANARAWIAMVRRAVDVVGADKLLFVSHSREIVELADARIEVGTCAT